MKLEIKASYGRTVNLGNFETVRIDASINEEIDPTDERPYEEILAELYDECENFVLKKCEVETNVRDRDKPENRTDDIPF